MKTLRLGSFITVVLVCTLLFTPANGQNAQQRAKKKLPNRALVASSKSRATRKATVYRRMFYLTIPNGSDEVIDPMADVPANMRLAISYIGCRAVTPQGQKIKMVIDGLGEAMPFIMLDQGEYGGYQHFVANHPFPMIYYPGGVSKGIIAYRNSTTGIANIQVLVIGEVQ